MAVATNMGFLAPKGLEMDPSRAMLRTRRLEWDFGPGINWVHLQSWVPRQASLQTKSSAQDICIMGAKHIIGGD